MGNCIAYSHLRHNERRALNVDDGEDLLEGNMEHQKPGRRLLAKKCNLPWLPTCQKASKCDRSTRNRQRVKVVLTRKQLQMLINGANEIKCRMVRDGYLKWRPSLATIPEL
nr:hypothetical protein JCGZ_13686 [Ipomoea trifida]